MGNGDAPMVEYRMGKDEIWHWFEQCLQWPERDFEAADIPKGWRPSEHMICEQCLSMEIMKVCRNHVRDVSAVMKSKKGISTTKYGAV